MNEILPTTSPELKSVLQVLADSLQGILDENILGAYL
jgi:hypothetical protein